VVTTAIDSNPMTNFAQRDVFNIAPTGG
jgi:hypothetical protein